MPYDNNLSRFGQPIIQMLSRGVQNGNLLVIVQSDFSEAPQLSRRIITKGKIDLKYLVQRGRNNPPAGNHLWMASEAGCAAIGWQQKRVVVRHK
jgi:hypothetical protein